MVKIVKMCDVDVYTAATLFKKFNTESVELRQGTFGPIIVTDIEPSDLVYPEGWYFANGVLTNRHTTNRLICSEIPMYRSNGTAWKYLVSYFTPFWDK